MTRVCVEVLETLTKPLFQLDDLQMLKNNKFTWLGKTMAQFSRLRFASRGISRHSYSSRRIKKVVSASGEGIYSCEARIPVQMGSLRHHIRRRLCLGMLQLECMLNSRIELLHRRDLGE